MHLLAMLFLALGISMDSFAVSLSNSITLYRADPARLLWIPAIFAIAQSTLAALGFFLGSFVGTFLETFEGPITFLVLAILGAEMIYSGIKAQRKEPVRKGEGIEPHAQPKSNTSKRFSPLGGLRGKISTEEPSRTTVVTVLIEALATSLDAFAIGFMLRAISTNPILACTVIALITFIVSVAGIIIGKRAGMILGEKAQLFGGIVLIGIGVLSLVT